MKLWPGPGILDIFWRRTAKLQSRDYHQYHLPPATSNELTIRISTTTTDWLENVMNLEYISTSS